MLKMRSEANRDTAFHGRSVRESLDCLGFRGAHDRRRRRRLRRNGLSRGRNELAGPRLESFQSQLALE